MWISLLFSMICLAVLSNNGPAGSNNNDEAQCREIESYRANTVKGLIFGEYTRPGPYVLETMLHYLYIEFGRYIDAQKDIWYVLALVVNVAFRMGYHRDPTRFPHINPLQSEMRRRVWATVVSCDMLISDQMGMPRLIADWKADTMEPRNFNDADIDLLTGEVPPPRPEVESTSSLSLIARLRVLRALGSIMDLNAGVRRASYADVMRIDLALDEAAAAVPPLLKMRPMSLSITEGPQVIMSRIFISFLFHKGKTLLHRPFLTTGSPMFEQSRRACLDASLEMLRLHKILDEETQPGVQLSMMRWRVSSIINHHSLTATMIVCSFVHRGRTQDRRAEIIEALLSASTTWSRNTSSSDEARRAAETIDRALKELGTGGSTTSIVSGFHTTSWQSNTASSTHGLSFDIPSGTPDFSWADSAWSPSDPFALGAPGDSSSMSNFASTPRTPHDLSMQLESSPRGSSRALLDEWMM